MQACTIFENYLVIFLCSMIVANCAEDSTLPCHRLWRQLDHNNHYNEKGNFPTHPSRLNRFSPVVEGNLTRLAHSVALKAKWKMLFLFARKIAKQMFRPNPDILAAEDIYVLVYSREVTAMLGGFDTSFFFPGRRSKVIIQDLNVTATEDDVIQNLHVCLEIGKGLKGLAIVSGRMDFIKLVLSTVATNSVFKWTHLLHATEWFVLTVEPTVLSLTFLNKSGALPLPDFLTFTYLHRVEGYTQGRTRIIQKSRTQLAAEVSTNGLFPESHLRQGFTLQGLQGRLRPPHDKPKRLRPSADRYLRRKKSIMAGMRLRVVVLESINEGFAYPVESHTNHTEWRGFSVAVLLMLNNSLDFTFDFVIVNDSGYYGLIDSDGQLFGVPGYLFRREAGLNIMPMQSNERRRKWIDFLSTEVCLEPYYIIYRARTTLSELGDFKAGLIKTRTETVNVIFIPACVGLSSGVLVFLVTGVLLNNKGVWSSLNLRRLYNFPFHWVFQTQPPYPHTSARILRASYGLCCIVTFSVYRASLTSESSVPREYPVISSLDDLLALSDYEIGISPESSATITAFKTALPETEYARVWDTIVKSNASDARVMGVDRTYHLDRVMHSRYAFIGNAFNFISPNDDRDYSDLRFSKIMLVPLHLSLPKHAFYREELERVLPRALETGLFQKMMDDWVAPDGSEVARKTNAVTTIRLSRFKLVYCIVCGCLACAALCLLLEKLVHNVSVVRIYLSFLS